MSISTDELKPTIYLYYRIRQGGDDQTDIIVTMEEASVNDQLDKLANRSLKTLGPQFETRVMQHAVNQAVEQIVKYIDNADVTILNAIDSGFIIASIVGGTAVIWSSIPIVAILLIAGFYVLFYSKPHFQIRSEANELSRQARLEVEKLQRRHPEWGIAD